MQVRLFALGRMLHVLGLAALLALSSGVHAQSGTKQADIYMHEAANREQRLIEGARKEPSFSTPRSTHRNQTRGSNDLK
jgi:hypothetical protein